VRGIGGNAAAATNGPSACGSVRAHPRRRAGGDGGGGGGARGGGAPDADGVVWEELLSTDELSVSKGRLEGEPLDRVRGKIVLRGGGITPADAFASLADCGEHAALNGWCRDVSLCAFAARRATRHQTVVLTSR